MSLKRQLNLSFMHNSVKGNLPRFQIIRESGPSANLVHIFSGETGISQLKSRFRAIQVDFSETIMNPPYITARTNSSRGRRRIHILSHVKSGLGTQLQLVNRSVETDHLLRL